MRKRDIVRKLRRARELVEKGWIQNSMQRDGAFCALGALEAVKAPIEVKQTFAKVISKRNDLLERAKKAAVECRGNDQFCQICFDTTFENPITGFNDRKKTTKKAVLRKFDEAISLLGG